MEQFQNQAFTFYVTDANVEKKTIQAKKIMNIFYSVFQKK